MTRCYDKTCVLFQLLDVFGQKSNVSLVFDFMDTDLEVSLLYSIHVWFAFLNMASPIENVLCCCFPPQIIIKDSTLILTPPHIKSYMLQTCLGLEYLHAHWILHRVCMAHSSFSTFSPCFSHFFIDWWSIFILFSVGYETEQSSYQ